MAENRVPSEKNRSKLQADCSRRDFIKRSGYALAGTMLASQGALAVNSAPKKIRIGVVGGGFGTAFQWHEHPDCVVEAVSDLREDRRKRLMKVYNCRKVYNCLEELVLDKNIDAVAIFTDGPLHGLTYMMAETGHYQQSTISARKFYRQGKFGALYYCEAEYQHPGLKVLYFWNGKRTWRYGVAPMHYPTHCTSQLVGVTGERLTEVVCHGWGDDSPIHKDNVYGNPFWNESAMFRTNRGNAFRVNIWWKGAHRGCERAQWIGDKMSFYAAHPNGLGPVVIRSGRQREKDDAGFVREAPKFERYKQPQWWNTDMLPESLRHKSGHEGSHTFLTHEFIDALVHSRRPAIDVYESLAYTVPGIVAHQSSLRKGERIKIPQYDQPT
jgi:predicted dehydrogenase